jgi:hypothetical protein
LCASLTHERVKIYALAQLEQQNRPDFEEISMAWIMLK